MQLGKIEASNKRRDNLCSTVEKIFSRGETSRLKSNQQVSQA
jgi:hypothetical protein